MKKLMLTFCFILIATSTSANTTHYESQEGVKYAYCEIKGLLVEFVTIEKDGTTFTLECEEDQFFLLYEYQDDYYFAHYRIFSQGNEHSWYGYVMEPIMKSSTRVKCMKGSTTEYYFDMGEVTEAMTCPSKKDFCSSKKFNWLQKMKRLIKKQSKGEET